jgi:hypothetical protein
MRRSINHRAELCFARLCLTLHHIFKRFSVNDSKLRNPPLLFHKIHPSSKELAETLKELLTTLVEKITAEDFWKLQAISLVVLMANQIPTSFVIGEALMTS